jgi:Zn-dependent peptidase ImmA (M78 family)
LVIGVEEQARWKDDAQALQRWRRAVEQHQVFVFQFRLSLDEARGFSLVEQARPAIVLNRTDIPSARSFTLFHELGHVLLSQPGICLPAEGGIGRGKSVETFCNQFAAALLVPTIDLEQHIPKALDESNFRALARRYAVSRLVVLGRLRSLGIVSAAVYGRFSSQWNKRRHESLPDSRPTRRGPTAAQRCLFERGQPFVSLVLAAAKRELITLNDAMTYLGTKVQGYRELTERA